DIVIVGRRGPAQASFTTPELQELGELAGADVVVDPADLQLDPRSEASLELVRNRLEERNGALAAVPTDEHETLECGLVFRSVGYRGVALPELPFEERRGTIRNDCGRVLAEDGRPVRGVYCAGWIKRGPTGIIGTNK